LRHSASHCDITEVRFNDSLQSSDRCISQGCGPERLVQKWWSWSWSFSHTVGHGSLSVAHHGVVHSVLVLNVKFHLHKFKKSRGVYKVQGCLQSPGVSTKSRGVYKVQGCLQSPGVSTLNKAWSKCSNKKVTEKFCRN